MAPLFFIFRKSLLFSVGNLRNKVYNGLMKMGEMPWIKSIVF